MKYVGILSVAAVLVAGFAYYTLIAGPTLPEAVNSVSTTDTVQPSTPQETDSSVRESFAGAGSLSALYDRNEPIECQVTYIPNPLESEITGTFFVANNKVRGDFLVPTPDLHGQMLSSIIFVDNTLYAWSDINGELYGFKMSDTSFAAVVDGEVSPVPATTEIQYDCLTWPAVDYTIFEPPTSVLFTDMSTVLKEFETGTIYLESEGEF